MAMNYHEVPAPFLPGGWNCGQPNSPHPSYFRKPIGRRPKGYKSQKAFIWPKDGKNGSKIGRWKDILNNEGPDIHVASRHEFGWDRPSRARWSRWTELNAFGYDNSVKPIPWAKRDIGEKYDFRTRKWGTPNLYSWSDVRWPETPNDQFTRPSAYRCSHGQWYQIFRQASGGVPLPAYDYRQRASYE